MDLLHTFVDYILHFDVHLDFMIQHYHQWTYLLLFLVVFVETGLVVMPFLPGDSLLFAIGAFTARGSFDYLSITITLICAATLGDNINYFAGKFIGPKIFTKTDNPFLNKKNLDHAQTFYDRHGAKTIVLARFLPIVRTFAPFVAGIGKMTYKRFISYSLFGGVLWILTFISLGYFFGNLNIVKENFKFVMLVIVLISVLPGFIEYARQNKFQKKV